MLKRAEQVQHLSISKLASQRMFVDIKALVFHIEAFLRIALCITTA